MQLKRMDSSLIEPARKSDGSGSTAKYDYIWGQRSKGGETASVAARPSGTSLECERATERHVGWHASDLVRVRTTTRTQALRQECHSGQQCRYSTVKLFSRQALSHRCSNLDDIAGDYIKRRHQLKKDIIAVYQRTRADYPAAPAKEYSPSRSRFFTPATLLFKQHSLQIVKLY